MEIPRRAPFHHPDGLVGLLTAACGGNHRQPFYWLLPIFILGFSPSAVYAYLVFVSFHAIFIHANVRFRFPGVRWLIATPEFHHWHHSSEDEAVDKNYAAFLPIYDKLFGTLIMPDRLAAEYGTRASTQVPEGVVKQFLFPFRRG
jgi:sterol desaturase/sphingolipid hydroxylase (fatty acid hydroxylase superfamily)